MFNALSITKKKIKIFLVFKIRFDDCGLFSGFTFLRYKCKSVRFMRTAFTRDESWFFDCTMCDLEAVLLEKLKFEDFVVTN